MLKKFENWPNDTKIKFIQLFTDQYNQNHKTNYQISKNTLDDYQDYDFALYHAKEMIKVQHTFMYLDGKDYIKDKKLNELIDKCEVELKDQIKGVFVYVNFSKFPVTNDDTKKLVFFLSGLIKDKVRKDKETLFSYSKRNEVYLRKIDKWVDELEIIKTNHPRYSLSFGNYISNNCLLMNEDKRFALTLLKKKKKYGCSPKDIILLVHNNSHFPVEELFLGSIRKLCNDEEYREIWLYDEFGSKFRILKMQEIEDKK